MKLSQQNAMQIVTEINNIIEQKINIMDSSGTIIASSNPVRIGTFHEAAKKLVENNLEELIIYTDDEYVGCKKGVNFPIVFHDETVGVLGITGPYDEVSKFGLVVKRMTEILILENTKKEEEALFENIKNRFIYEWMNVEEKGINHEMINEGKMLDIDITIPRRIMILSLLIEDSTDNVKGFRIIGLAEQYMKQLIKQLDKDNVFLKSGNNLVCALTARSDKEMLKSAENIKNVIENRYPLRLAIGIDNDNTNYKLVHLSFVKANKALESCLRTHKRDIKFYDDLNMEIFADDISDSVKQEYINKIFKGYSDENIAEAVHILEVLYDENGSITTAANKLFIHKNTLQYKLKRIQEQTGYDPRSINYLSLFYNAIYFYKDIRDIRIINEK